jgi:hypothetical protein
MRDQQMKRDLERLHAQGSNAEPRPEHRVELESRLLSRYRDRESRTRRWLMLLNPWNRTARFALVGLALMILGVGACTTSTTTEMEMGYKVAIELNNKAVGEIDVINGDLTRYLDTLPGLESVSVGLHEKIDGSAGFEIIAFGTGLDAESLVAGIRREVPRLNDAVIDSEVLTGTLRESFASKMRREVFHLEVEGATAEEIRAEVMAQLAAAGQAEGAEVEVILEDGLTEIKITVEEDVED